MARVTRPGGTILLLEHGRSHLSLVNRYLDARACAWQASRGSDSMTHAGTHARDWGCWWNRDVPALVREAGLRVVEHRTFNLGTTHWIVAAPAD